jgi:ATP-dependent DNA helicase RecG
MAPTEILAQQHFRSLSSWLVPVGIRIGILTGGTRARERREVLELAERGEIDVVVGTHALFEDQVALSNLGVAIVDEQHRFGVKQRSRLRQKGVSPHLIAMTATPIPRTLQLTLYGDLDISIIDELPPGRVPIETRLVPAPGPAYKLAAEQIALGRQVFVVCPVIDESLDDDMKSAVAEHKRLSKDVFPRLSVALLHGKMKPKEKDAVLEEFRDGRHQILVATSVVEVGIDVPNASVMVIRDAHRFGLAQLHQLRGRIGRGSHRSYCLLVSPAGEGPTRERLDAVVASQDGFVLAEKDLELRGPGEFWGTRQSGMPELQVAGPGDGPVVELARRATDLVMKKDPELSSPQHALLREHVERFWMAEAELH